MEDPLTQYMILDTVEKGDGSLTQREIAQRTGRCLSAINYALRLLAVKGYIKISGANPKRLRYHITPVGLLQKAVLAYSFVKKQSALYEEVRHGLLDKLRGLAREGVQKVSVYGWTPLTETAILFLISEGVQVSAIYVEKLGDHTHCNRIPFARIEDCADDCDVMVLMEPLPEMCAGQVLQQKLGCFPPQ